MELKRKKSRINILCYLLSCLPYLWKIISFLQNLISTVSFFPETHLRFLFCEIKIKNKKRFFGLIKMSLKIDIFAEVHKGIYVIVALGGSMVYSY